MFTALDWVILGGVGLSSLLSVIRGFAREASSIASWIIAFFVSSKLYLDLAPRLTFLDDPLSRKCVAVIILFIGALIVTGFISKLVCSLINKAGLSGVDRLLGICFGAARGVLIVSALYALLKILFVFRILTFIQGYQWYQDSALIPELEKIVNWFFLYMGNTDISAPSVLENGLENFKTGA